MSTETQREHAFSALRAALPPANMEAALRCSVRLKDALPHPERLDRNLVLVAYGGGKDSSYTLAFVRAMQLILFRAYGTTFRLRVATNRHAGMPRAVLENVERAYQALRLADDPGCELLLIDGNEVTPFDVDALQHPEVIRRNRIDILMTGHRTFADGRPTFCNACNLSVFNSFGVAAAYAGGADVIITGDSRQEQRQYVAWVSRMTRRLAPATRPGPGENGKAAAPGQDSKAAAPGQDSKAAAPGQDSKAAVPGENGLGRLLSHLDRIGQAYFAGIHGPDAAEALAERRVNAAVPPHLRFFSIYSDTTYDAGDHMELLTGFLGFQFDDLAFSFTESDCGNPALMAHLRGLKCERVYRRSYDEGMAEYVEFALGLMRKKDFPPELITQMRGRYDSPDAIARMRRAASDYATATFGLTDTQLVCMVYSPFAEKGAGLEEFLQREHPALADRPVHALLADESHDDPALARELERISGLELSQLRVLYRSSLRRTGREGTDVIDVVLAGDPHKAVIPTRHAPDGPAVLELISGR